MTEYLLDSDVLIWHLRGKPKIKELVISLGKLALLYCSALTVAEIEAGMLKGEEQTTRQLINGLQVQNVDSSIAMKAGQFIRTYRSKGQTLDIVDSVIAATAVIKNLVLVTANARHYPMPEIKLLKAKI